MTLPWSPEGVPLWRLDTAMHAHSWDSGIGALRAGGRWNPIGFAVVYCSVDPATTILESAVHKGFNALDTVPHILTCARLNALDKLFVLNREDVPNANWLRPGTPSQGQQQFGKQLVEQRPFVAIPSVVSEKSWNIIFNPTTAKGLYSLVEQTRFSLDTRLNIP